MSSSQNHQHAAVSCLRFFIHQDACQPPAGWLACFDNDHTADYQCSGKSRHIPDERAWSLASASILQGCTCSEPRSHSSSTIQVSMRPCRACIVSLRCEPPPPQPVMPPPPPPPPAMPLRPLPGGVGGRRADPAGLLLAPLHALPRPLPACTQGKTLYRGPDEDIGLWPAPHNTRLQWEPGLKSKRVNSGTTRAHWTTGRPPI
jgi:hypothetical protein